MKQITNFLKEGLRINKNTNVDNILNKDYIVALEKWPRSRVAIIIDILKNYVKMNKKDLDKDQIKFANNLRYELEFYWKDNLNVANDPKLIKLINGESPEFKNLKCIYDAICWTLEKDDTCTKPRRHKLELIIDEIGKYEDQIQQLEW